MDESLGGGIINLSNTCYLSCTLQILLRYNPFVKLMEDYAQKYKDIRIFNIIADMAEKQRIEHTPLNPEPLTSYLSIDVTKQQDINEFLAYLINYLIEKLPKDDQKPLIDMFSCKLYNSTGKPNEQIIIYEIPVDQKLTVDEALKKSLDTNCERFSHPPNVFFLQLHRLYFNKMTKTQYKRSDPMKIPTSIDLSSYGGRLYHMAGVVQHIGTSVYGHYRIGIQDSHGWMIANDRYVRRSTIEEIMTSSISANTPAYLLAFVSDLSDIAVLRKVAEKDVIDVNGPFVAQKTTVGDIKCAFEYKEDIEPRKENQSIEVIIQPFNQSSMEFGKPDKLLFSTKEEALMTIDQFRADNQTEMVFGYDKQVFSSSIPENFGELSIPLYIMVQSASYRKFLYDPFSKSIVKVIYIIEHTPRSFSTAFYGQQNISELTDYCIKYMRSVFESVSDYSIMIEYYNNYLARPCHKIHISKITNSNKLIVHVYPSTSSYLSRNPKSFIPIKIHRQNNPADVYKTIEFPVRVNTRMSHILKACFCEEVNCRLFQVRSEAFAEEIKDPIDQNALYSSQPDLRLVMNADRSTSLFAVYMDGSYVENFFYNVPDSFEKLYESIKPFVAFSNFTITFHGIGVQPTSEGNPLDLVTKCEGDFYFSIESC